MRVSDRSAILLVCDDCGQFGHPAFVFLLCVAFVFAFFFRAPVVLDDRSLPFSVRVHVLEGTPNLFTGARRLILFRALRHDSGSPSAYMKFRRSLPPSFRFWTAGTSLSPHPSVVLRNHKVRLNWVLAHQYDFMDAAHYASSLRGNCAYCFLLTI